jgi:hypothetical protein
VTARAGEVSLAGPPARFCGSLARGDTMAKRGTLTHRRTRRLAALLRIPLPFALGVMEAVWHATSANAPAGDIGRLSDQDLADEVYWEGQAGELVEALVSAGVLERHPQHRLVVHGWSEHADSTLRHKLKRARATFWDGSPPFGHAVTPTADDRSATEHDPAPTVADDVCRDEIDPAYAVAVAEPSPAPTPPDNGSPPGPPAPRVGTGGGAVLQVGDRLPDGREVLEVDDRGRPTVVSRGEGTAPRLTAEAAEAIDRLVAHASSRLGYRFTRADRRRLRERLLGGETEAQIRAGYDAQVAVLEAAEAASAPPDESDDEELDQALRLVSGASAGGLAAAGRGPS